MKILGTGLTGLVGSQVITLLGDRHQFENISRSTGVDITNKEQVYSAVSSSSASLVLHLAAKADVDGCERDKEALKDGDAWKMNVLATEYIANACKATGKKLLYVSTDFVFDGEHTPESGYTEEDIPNPLNWYAVTKYEGEKIVTGIDESSLILRLAYPYRDEFPAKKDFVQAILGRLQNGAEVQAVTDHMMTPTYGEDFAHAIDLLIRKNASGIYHTVGNQYITPFAAVQAIATTFAIANPKIRETTREVFFQNRAIRPFNLSLNNGKIKSLGATMHSFSEGLQLLKKQI